MSGKWLCALGALVLASLPACAKHDATDPSVSDCAALGREGDAAALAALYRDHVPTAPEAAEAAYVWAALLASARRPGLAGPRALDSAARAVLR